MATQVVPVSCPTCGTQYRAPVQNVIDGQDTALKSAFLQGRLSVTQCPQCGAVNPLNLPIFYYDLSKELAFTFTPGGVMGASPQHEKMIGDMTNALVESLPTEQRKFYLLNPKPFLTMESMFNAILEADGITPEIRARQEAKVKLLQELMQAKDESQLKAITQEREDEMDREFFDILTASIQNAYMEGNSMVSQSLLTLRNMLGRWSSKARQVIKDIDTEMTEQFVKSQDELQERLLKVSNDQEFAALVSMSHQLLDYAFFQKLTAKIDQTKDPELKAKLMALRSKILEVKGKQEAEARQAMEDSTKLLETILQSDQPEDTLRQNLDNLNETFFMVLSTNIEEAARQNQNDAVQVLSMIGNAAMAMLQQKQGAPVETPPPGSQIYVPR